MFDDLDGELVEAVLGDSPLFAAEVARVRAVRETEQRRAEQAERERWRRVAGAIADRVTREVTAAEKKVADVRAYRRSVVESGEKVAEQRRYFSDVLHKNTPAFAERLKGADFRLATAEQELAAARARLAEVQRLTAV